MGDALTPQQNIRMPVMKKDQYHIYMFAICWVVGEPFTLQYALAIIYSYLSMAFYLFCPFCLPLMVTLCVYMVLMFNTIYFLLFFWYGPAH